MMKNSKFEIRNSKDLARAARMIRIPDSRHPNPRDPQLVLFEFRNSNFEFPPHAALV